MWTAARTFDLETIETNLRILDIARSALDASYLEWTRTVRCEKSPLDTTKSTHLRKKSWTTVAVAGALWEYENGSQELRASGLCVGKESGRLGHPMNDIEYPDVRVELTKTDRNSYAIIGRLRRALRDARVSCRGVLRQGDFGRLRNDHGQRDKPAHAVPIAISSRARTHQLLGSFVGLAPRGTPDRPRSGWYRTLRPA